MQQGNRLQSPARRFIAVAMLTFSLAIFQSADAGTIKKVKGKAVIIDLEGDDASRGDVVYAVDGRGKRLGAIRITKVKGDRAAGRIIKGKARRGWETMAKGGGGGSRSARRSRGGSKMSRKSSSMFTIGGVVGMNLNSMAVKLGADETEVRLSGSGLGFNIMSDIKLGEAFSVRAIAGLDKFEATGTSEDALCEGSEDCITSINYLSVTALARYAFTQGSMPFWGGAGLSILSPSSSESNAIEVDSIKLTTGIIAAFGVDYWINDRMYIPLQASYNFLPPSDNVSASYIQVKTGFAMQF